MSVSRFKLTTETVDLNIALPSSGPTDLHYGKTGYVPSQLNCPAIHLSD